MSSAARCATFQVSSLQQYDESRDAAAPGDCFGGQGPRLGEAIAFQNRHTKHLFKSLSHRQGKRSGTRPDKA